MDNFETILNEAIKHLQAGKSLEEVLALYPQHKEELSLLLALTARLTGLPKKAIPEPARQRKYAFAVKEHWSLAWLHVSKFASISMGVVLIISAIAGTGYAASKAVAGDTLFKLKTAMERLQLTFTFSQEQRANLEVRIAQKRLTEAQAVFNNPSSNTEQEQLAINELLTQTQSAIDVADTVAKSSNTQTKSQEVVNTLENINQEQKTLLTKINPAQAGLSGVADTALKQVAENTIKVDAIKQYMAAASKETSLTDLPVPTSTPESIEGLVKGDSTTTASSTAVIVKANDITASSTKKNLSAAAVVKSADDSSSTAPTDPNTATGSFIPEDPSPQSPF